MNKRYFLGGLAALAFTGTSAYVGLTWYASRRAVARQDALLIGGAAVMADLNKALAKEFQQTRAVQVIVEKGGSLQGLLAAKRGAIDIAAMSRDLIGNEAQAEAHNYLIARDAISIIVHPSCVLKQLSPQMVHDVLTGRIDNWKVFGGPNEPIHVISRQRESTTLRFVSEAVLDRDDMSVHASIMESKAAVMEQVRRDPYAIGFVATDDGMELPGVRALEIDGVPISRETLLSQRYPYTRSLHLLLYGAARPLAYDYVAFAQSPKGQDIVKHMGFIPVR